MKKLNSQQQDAVFSEEKHLLCLAGAGTGKTTCMLSRIEHLLDLGADPSSILVLTFTNAAALEMASRFMKSNQCRCPEFRTFHSFCYYLIASDKLVLNSIGYINAVPDIATDEDEKSIADFVSLQISFKMNPKNIRKLIWEESGLRYQEALWKNAYLNELRRRNKITFDVLCTSVCKLFSEDHLSISKYKQKYKYIFVDEFQDTDVQQWEFVNSFKDAYIFLVGDALQNIYQFRGCTNSVMKKLASRSDWECLKLTENYRSTKVICDYSNKFSSTCSENSYRVAIHSDKPGDSMWIKNFNFNSSLYGQYGNEILDSLVKDISKVKETETCAILVRTNKEVDSVSKYLTSRNIAHSTKEVEYEEKARILQSVINNEFFLGFLESKLPPQNKFEWIRISFSESDPKNKLSMFLKLYRSNYRVNKCIDEVLHIRKLLSEVKSVYDAAVAISNNLQLDMNESQLVECSKNSNTSSELINAILEKLNTKPQFNSNIYVGTIHSVKGLEFDHVYVLGVGSKTFPVYSGEDMNNLFYVAITRAKSHLTIYKEATFSLEDEYGL